MIYSGFLIRKERLRRNWSQEGLCKGICAVSYLSKIEQGKTEVSEDILEMLFKKLGIHWMSDEKSLSEGEKFIEDWYDSFFSYDFEKASAYLKKTKTEFACLKSSPFAIDVFLLEKFESDEPPLDEKLESCMDSRQLALQRILQGDFSSAEKLYPSALVFLRSGYSDYEKGNNYSALEKLSKAYDLAAEEGRAKVMMFAKLFITNCYSNIGDLDSMERHGKIAKRLALQLGENSFAETVDYNFAATKIETGDYEGAYEYFSKLSEPSAQSLHKLAICCEKLGKKEEAAAAIEKEKFAKSDYEKDKILADEACKIIKFRLENEDYLENPDYGKRLLEFFEFCRKEMPVGYAKFNLPWVLEWYTANRQYKQAFELMKEF